MFTAINEQQFVDCVKEHVMSVFCGGLFANDVGCSVLFFPLMLMTWGREGWYSLYSSNMRHEVYRQMAATGPTVSQNSCFILCVCVLIPNPIPRLPFLSSRLTRILAPSLHS
jgi:hypothetical protein